MSASKYRSQTAGLLLLGILLEAACLEIVRIGDLRTALIDLKDLLPDLFYPANLPLHTSLLLFWLPFTAAFLVYLVGIRQSSRVESRADDRIIVGMIIGIGIVCRFTLLFSPPTLSDDIFRYVWDGRMQNQGINPYQYPPDAEEIAPLKDEFHEGINNKHISTIYPPLTEMMFRLIDLVWHHPAAMKVFFMLCDIAIIFLVLSLLRAEKMPSSRVLIYAWNPLIMVEFAGSGHNDTLALALMLAALPALAKRKDLSAMTWLALSFLAKFFAVVLIPAFYRIIRSVKPFWLIPIIIILFYLPYIDAGMQLFHGLRVYGDKWRFNDSIFSLLVYTTGSLDYAKLIIAGLFSGVVLIRFVMKPDTLKSAYWIVGAYLLLTPTFQPWYLVWVMPFLCLYPNRAWIMLTGLAAVSYHVVIQFVQTGIWSEATWIRYVQFIPFYSLLIIDSINNNLMRRNDQVTDRVDRRELQV